jgi:Mg2+-importing ATPase
MKKKSTDPASVNIMDKLTGYARGSINDIYAGLNSSPKGLDTFEAELRLEVYGPNQIAAEKPKHWLIQLVLAFINPFTIILFFLAGISLVMDVLLAKPGEQSWRSVIVISLIVLISGTLRFIQEFRSGKEAEKLKALVHTTAAVIRNGAEEREIEMTEIVPGDVIQLAAGDMIPADVRIITSKDLFISQSSLTGESEPIEKYSLLRQEQDVSKGLGLSDLDNICFMGTTVVSGSALAVALSTGNDTYLGAMAKTLVGKRELTSFDKGINSVSPDPIHAGHGSHRVSYQWNNQGELA